MINKIDLQTCSWNDYVTELKKDKDLDIRILQLESSKTFFNTFAHFNLIPYEDRRRLAGFNPRKEHFGKSNTICWWYFGNTRGAGYFKGAIKSNNVLVSNALDYIPLTGSISKMDYINYIKTFTKINGGGIATATRLLTMKRPDYFFCYNSANKDFISENFKFTINDNSSSSLEVYWDKLIDKLLQSNLWNTVMPTNQLELDIWKNRVALIDCLITGEY